MREGFLDRVRESPGLRGAIPIFPDVDVFTDKPFGGNPLAVFPDAEGLTTEEMQSLARERTGHAPLADTLA